MTDQQTSRTKIIEALRDALADQALYIEDDDGNEVAYDAVAERLAAALAAEPRSDAVTAPDEPIHLTVTPETWSEMETRAASAASPARDRMRCGQCGDELLPSEVEGHLNSEGRTASASVPPLDRERLVEAINATPALDGLLHVRRVEHRHVRRFVDAVAAAYDAAGETPARQSLECPMCGGKGLIFDITDAVNEAIAAGSAMVVPLAAETPEQGRGDEGGQP